MKIHSRSLPSVIYKVTNTLNGNFYIGVTTQPLRWRLSQHFSNALTKSHQGRFQRAIRRYGKDAFVIEELARFETGSDGLAAEIEFISRLKPPYNSTTGGEGAPGHRKSKRARQLISQQKTGNQYRLGSLASEETRRKQRELGLQNRERFAQYAHLGPQAASRPVICLNDGMKFASVKAAGRFYGVHSSSITEVCLHNPRRVSAGGRVFRYVGDFCDPEREVKEAETRRANRAKIVSQKLKFPVICLNDNIVYPSAIEAAEHYGVTRGFIGEICRGLKESRDGLKFAYLEKVV